MPTDQIITLLIAERDKLNRAIEALQGPSKKSAAQAGRTRPSQKTDGDRRCPAEDGGGTEKALGRG